MNIAIVLCLVSVVANPCLSQMWAGLPLYLDYAPSGLYVDSAANRLYVFGSFQKINGDSTNGIISFDGSQYYLSGLGSVMDRKCEMYKFDDRLFLGGSGIEVFENNQCTHIPMSGVAFSLYEYENQLLMGGLFDTIDGLPLSTLAAYDGTGWHEALGTQAIFSNLNCSINSIREFQGDLYLAGNIDHLGDMKEIMKWNGTSWMDVAGGIRGGGSTWVNDLEVYHGELYVAGHFFEAEGSPGNNVAKWDGYQWHRLGNGIPQGQVNDLYVFNDYLYVAGAFYEAGGISCNFVSRWDGVEWCSFGGEIDNAIHQLIEFQGGLVASGGFQVMGGDSTRFIATWMGGSHVDSCQLAPLGVYQWATFDLPRVAPNPACFSFAIEISGYHGPISFRILDLQGREVLPQRSYRAGDPPVDVSMLPAGVYVVQVRTYKGVQNVKLVVN